MSSRPRRGKKVEPTSRRGPFLPLGRDSAFLGLDDGLFGLLVKLALLADHRTGVVPKSVRELAAVFGLNHDRRLRDRISELETRGLIRWDRGRNQYDGSITVLCLDQLDARRVAADDGGHHAAAHAADGSSAPPGTNPMEDIKTSRHQDEIKNPRKIEERDLAFLPNDEVEEDGLPSGDRDPACWRSPVRPWDSDRDDGRTWDGNGDHVWDEAIHWDEVPNFRLSPAQAWSEIGALHPSWERIDWPDLSEAFAACGDDAVWEALELAQLTQVELPAGPPCEFLKALAPKGSESAV